MSEAVVLFRRPWLGSGVKRFIGDNGTVVGFALGTFLVGLYRERGRALEIAVRHEDGSTEVLSGDEWEQKCGLPRSEVPS